MKKLILIGIFLSITAFLFSQDLHIYYNSQNENIRYEYNGKEIKRPKVRRDGNIFLHIENFNNYLLDVDVSSKNEEIIIPESSNSLSLPVLSSVPSGDFSSMGFGNLKNGLPLFSPVAGNVLANLKDFSAVPEIEEVDEEEMGFGEKNKRSEETSLYIFSKKFKNILINLDNTEKEIKRAIEDVDKIMEARTINAFALEEVRKLKTNPQLKPEQIKELSTEYLKKVLNVSSPEEITLSNLLEKSDTKKQLVKKLSVLEKEKSNYNAGIAELSELSSSLDDYSLDAENEAYFLNTLQTILSKSEETKTDLQSYSDYLEEVIPTVGKEDIQNLIALRYEYEAINANTFSHTYRTIAKGDNAIFNVEFSPLDSINSNKSIKIAPIVVPVFGGFKVNASVGISFGQFKNRPQSYFVRDSIIRAEDKDSFLPMLTSFIHFYSQGSGNVSFGGSFGLGVPIGNSENIQSATFFFGPSLILGKGERLVLSAGVMGGRVKRLGNGYKTGDVYISDANVVPTSYPYEFGYFAGLSFNLTGIGQ